MSSEEEIILEFGSEMLKKMIQRRKRYKPLGWRDPEYKTMNDLWNHLEEEYKEIQEAVDNKQIQEELIDLAICALMLWDRIELNKEKLT